MHGRLPWAVATTTRRQLRQCEDVLTLLVRALPFELHGEETSLYGSHLSDVFSKLGDLGNHWLDLVDFGNLVRVQNHVVPLLYCSNYLGQRKLGGHKLLKTFLRLIKSLDLFAIFVSLIKRTCQFVLLLLTEAKDLPLSFVEIFLEHQA